MKVPNKIWLYRITHISNLPFILQNGLYTRESTQFDPNYKSIGDTSLISYRKTLHAIDPPGGQLSEYIPFYLGPRSPMLYQIAKGYENIEKHPQENIVYLISSFDKVIENRLQYFFTDGHARSNTTTYYNTPGDFQYLDWDAIQSLYWKSDEADLRRKEKKQAEMLIKTHLPVNCIEYIGVFNQQAEEKVLDLLTETNLTIEVKISPSKLYYDNI